MMMRKIIPLVALSLVILASGYNYFSSRDNSGNTFSANTEVSNNNGDSLTSEEAKLPVTKGGKKVIFKNLGMTCSSCQAAVRAVLKETNGVKASFVNLKLNRATVVIDPTVVSIEEVKKRITDIGFRVEAVKEVAQQ